MALQDTVMGRIVRVADIGATVATVAVAVVMATTVVARYAGRDDAAGDSQLASGVGEVISPGRHVKADARAKVVIVEFSDFECQFCRLYARDQYRLVLKDLVDAGVADYAFRHFPLDVVHPRAFVASQAAECAAEQGRFWEMHDALFTQTLSDVRIREHAAGVGLDLTAFEACVAEERRGPILEDLEAGKRIGIAGTPSFVIGVKRADGNITVTKVLPGMQGLSALKAAVAAAGGV